MIHFDHKQKTVVLKTLMLAVNLSIFTSSYAQTAPDNLWHGNVAVGGAATSGNSSTQTFNLNADGARATVDDKISLRALVNYGNSTVNGIKTRNAELYRVGGRYDYNVSTEVFLFGGAEFENNRIQNIQTRYLLNGGAGYKVIRSEATTWDVFAGVGYSDTQYYRTIPPSLSGRSGAEVLFGEESTHKLGTSSVFKQRWVVYPGFGDLGVTSKLDLSLATAIVGNWTLNVAVALDYNSKPSNGFKTTNSLLSFGFGYKY